MREDIEIENDACAWAVWSRGLGGRTWPEAGDALAATAAAEAFFGLTLITDEGLNVRLLVGEELTDVERRGWVAQATSTLEVPDGKLVLSGGFDPSGREPHDPYCHVRDVRPGRYRLDVYTFMGSCNGVDALVGAARDEGLDLLEWATRSVSLDDPPWWLLQMLVEDPHIAERSPERWRDLVRSGLWNHLLRQVGSYRPLKFIVQLRGTAAWSRFSRPTLTGWTQGEVGQRLPPTCPPDIGFGPSADALPPSLARLAG